MMGIRQSIRESEKVKKSWHETVTEVRKMPKYLWIVFITISHHHINNPDELIWRTLHKLFILLLLLVYYEIPLTFRV